MAWMARGMMDGVFHFHPMLQWRGWGWRAHHGWGAGWRRHYRRRWRRRDTEIDRTGIFHGPIKSHSGTQEIFSFVPWREIPWSQGFHRDGPNRETSSVDEFWAISHPRRRAEGWRTSLNFRRNKWQGWFILGRLTATFEFWRDAVTVGRRCRPRLFGLFVLVVVSFVLHFGERKFLWEFIDSVCFLW